MNMPWNRALHVSITPLLVLAISLAPVAAADPVDTSVVHIAVTPIDSASEGYYAAEMGFFKNAGLNVELQEIDNGGAIATAIASGAIDVGVASPVPLALAHARGVPFTILFPAAVYDKNSPTTVMLVGKASPITTAKDLGGKIIGTQALQTISQLAPEQWIDAHGGDSKTAKFIEMPSSELPAALQSGRVDAIIAIEPTATIAAPNARLLGDVYGSLPAGFAINAWFTTSTWANAHPQLAAKFITAMRQTAVWANSHQTESRAILGKHTKVAAALLDNMKRCTYGTRADATSIQPNIDVAVKYGLLKTPFPAAELLYKP